MDPLTHAISGAALARAIPSKPLPRSQTVFLILLTMAPDADFILRFFSDTLYLQHHRGLTHSLLMLPLWGWLVYSLSSQRIKTQPIMPWLIGLALLLHISLDLITTFGTMILAPFSDWRASFDLLFIIDPLFTASLLIPLLAGFIWTQHKRRLGVISLALMLSYLGLVYNNQQQAITLTRTAHPDAQSFHALPLAFSPFNWQLIAKYPDHYARAAVNLKPGFSGTQLLFDEALANGLISTAMNSPDKIHWQELPGMHTVKNLDSLPGTAFYQWFARYPILLKQDKDSIEFGDLAFGGGAPGVHPAFQLRIHAHDAETNKPRAWLIWRNHRKSELTYTAVPFNWLQSD